MEHMTLSRRLRERRLAAGLTQAALAEKSGTSRVSIARIESGAARDYRVGTLVRLCRALGLELSAVAPGALERQEMRLAREQQRVRRLDARRRHATLAVRLLTAPPGVSSQLVARARRNVDRWERDRLCSAHYIARWRAWLAGSPREVARALLTGGAWTDALLQNTPWSFALTAAVP